MPQAFSPDVTSVQSVHMWYSPFVMRLDILLTDMWMTVVPESGVQNTT